MLLLQGLVIIDEEEKKILRYRQKRAASACAIGPFPDAYEIPSAGIRRRDQTAELVARISEMKWTGTGPPENPLYQDHDRGGKRRRNLQSQ